MSANAGSRHGSNAPARSASHGPLWGKVIAGHKNYAGYQTKTEREIPLVLLTPGA